MKITFFMLMIVMAVVNIAVRAEDAVLPKRVMVKRGNRANLLCGGFSVVKVGDVITWFKDGVVVTSYRVNNGQPTANQLVLDKVTDWDSGTYRCKVSSKDGIAKNHVVEVDVLVSTVNVSIRTDNNNNFEAGSPRVLACVVHGCLPSPIITWHLGDNMLRPNVYKEVNRGNFTVSSLTFIPSLTDNGKELVCKVSNNNAAGNFEDRVTVSVGYRPICIDSSFKTIGAVESESETLVCTVESDPEPEQFIWTFADGRTIYTSSKKVSGCNNQYSSTLVWVPRQDDFGPLYCRASNRFGEQKQPCTFSVINGGPPSTPECKMFWQDRDTLNVQCDKNWDGGRPQTIHLEVKGPEGTRKVSKKGHELKVNSVNPRVNFTAELYASNSRGRSSTVLLAIPGPPSDELEEHRYVSRQAEWALTTSLFLYITIVFMILIIWYLYQIWLRFRCTDVSSEQDGSFRRDEEVIEMVIGSPVNYVCGNDAVAALPQCSPPETTANQLAYETYYV